MPNRARAKLVGTALALSALVSQPARAEGYVFDGKRTEVRFAYQIGLAKQQGRFTRVSGTLQFTSTRSGATLPSRNVFAGSNVSVRCASETLANGAKPCRQAHRNHYRQNRGCSEIRFSPRQLCSQRRLSVFRSFQPMMRASCLFPPSTSRRVKKPASKQRCSPVDAFGVFRAFSSTSRA